MHENLIQLIGLHFQHIYQVSLLYLYQFPRYKRLSVAGLTDTHTHTDTQLIWAVPSLEVKNGSGIIHYQEREL